MARKRLSNPRNFSRTNISNVPDQSGVYVIKSRNGIPQYVGKAGAGRLRERLMEHLRQGDIRAANLFQIRLASSNAEALKLEQEYKKRLKPKQNIQ